MDFEIVYLTKEHIYMVHQNSIVEFGGEHGIFDYTDNRIDSILHQQYPIFGVDRYPSIFDKAAMLLYFFTKGHCFVDGNKRVGYQSTMVFLKVNGYEDITCEDDGYKQT